MGIETDGSVAGGGLLDCGFDAGVVSSVVGGAGTDYQDKM